MLFDSLLPMASDSVFAISCFLWIRTLIVWYDLAWSAFKVLVSGLIMFFVLSAYSDSSLVFQVALGGLTYVAGVFVMKPWTSSELDWFCGRVSSVQDKGEL